MNKIADIEKLNHSLTIQNNKLHLQVQVLSQQVKLFEKQLYQQRLKDQSYQKLEAENLTLKKDVMTLLEQIQTYEKEMQVVQEQKYIQQIEEMQRKHHLQINDLKKIYEEKIVFLQKEKASLIDQTTQIGIQNQTSKNLEIQTAKIIQIGHKLEKTLADLPTKSASHSHIGITKEVYDQMISQLKSSSNKHIEQDEQQQFFTQRQYKNSVGTIKKIKQFNTKKLLVLTRPIDSPRTQGNNLTISTIVNKKS